MTTGRRKPKSELTLKEEVRHALLDVLRDKAAPPTARASAGRTLYEMFKDDAGNTHDSKPAAEMTPEELDAEIARHSKQ